METLTRPKTRPMLCATLALMTAATGAPALAEGGVSDLTLYLSWFAPGAESPRAGQGVETEGMALVLYPLSAGGDQAEPVERTATAAEQAAIASAVQAMARLVTVENMPMPAPDQPSITVEWSAASDALFARGVLVLQENGLPPEVAALRDTLLGGAPAP